MRRVALIYNPASGQISARRKSAVEDAMAVLRQAGVEAEAYETGAPGSAVTLAKQAVDKGCDTILACGGDGTVHEVVQSLVGTDVALGVIPLGTANALAADLGLVAPPAKVARKLLEAAPARVSVGRIHFNDPTGNPSSRYFIVAAGIGADALLMSRLDARLKRRLGYVLYLIEAFRIWATSSFPMFEAVLPMNGNGHKRVMDVSQLLAVRVRSFGGVLRTLAPGASLRNGSLSLAGLQDAEPAELHELSACRNRGATYLYACSRTAGHALDRMPSAERIARCALRRSGWRGPGLSAGTA